MIWFSASWIFIILPNSVGLLALPLRMTSVLGSKMLTSFSDTCVSPPKIRAQACRITCSALGIIVSSSLRRPSRAACWKTSEDFLTPEAISREKRFACPTTRETDASNLPYPCCNFSLPAPPLAACGPSNLQNPVLHAPAAVPQFGPYVSSDGGDPLHRARQNTHAVAQQTAVGRIVDVGFNDGRI